MTMTTKTLPMHGDGARNPRSRFTVPIMARIWVSILDLLRKLGYVINLARIPDSLPGDSEEAGPDEDTDEAYYSFPPGAAFVGGGSSSTPATYNYEAAGDPEAPKAFYQSSPPTQEPQGSSSKSLCSTISVVWS